MGSRARRAPLGLLVTEREHSADYKRLDHAIGQWCMAASAAGGHEHRWSAIDQIHSRNIDSSRRRHMAGMTIQYPQCELGRNADAHELRALVCDAVVLVCRNVFGDRLRGIVLSGSLARQEGTFVWKSGRWSVLGDAEFFVIFEQRCSLPQATRMESVRQQAEQALLDRGVCCHIDLSPVHP